MKPYYQNEHVTLYHGDCIETMNQMPANSIDAIVTDPPYGLGFMGKKWDALPPGEEWARECLRVLKPGGHILAFGGTRTWHRLAVAIEDAGFEMRDSIAWLYGSGFPKHRAALKPAFEPIVMGRKPFKGSLTTNEAIHGTGALSIDACRIGSETRTWTPRLGHNANLNDDEWQGIGKDAEPREASGRWPANVLLDQHTAAWVDEQSGVSISRPHSATSIKTKRNAMAGGAMHGGTNVHSDSGGASRFFYVAKAPKSERPNVDGIQHPTVKPLAIMQWLCKLVTPTGGVILDPFAGSGTTIEAALIEGFNPIGIEMETDYLPLIQHRINRATS